jgi:hypothetical protein
VREPNAQCTNKMYLGNKGYPKVSLSDESKFIGKAFLVAYSPNDIINNEILLNEEDYKNFGLSFPDSLQWVVPYFR